MVGNILSTRTLDALIGQNGHPILPPVATGQTRSIKRKIHTRRPRPF